jgi:hypothetical protein
MTHLHFGTLNRFRADINADDLDSIITAPRESVGASDLKEKFEALLLAVFQEARQRYDDFIAAEERAEKEKKERARSFVSPAFIEHAIASALLQVPPSEGEPDDSWFYFSIQKGLIYKNLLRDCTRLIGSNLFFGTLAWESRHASSALIRSIQLSP